MLNNIDDNPRKPPSESGKLHESHAFLDQSLDYFRPADPSSALRSFIILKKMEVFRNLRFSQFSGNAYQEL